MTSQNKASRVHHYGNDLSNSCRMRCISQFVQIEFRAGQCYPFFSLGATSHIYHVDREGGGAKENEIEIPPKIAPFGFHAPKERSSFHSTPWPRAHPSSIATRTYNIPSFLGVFLGPPDGGSTLPKWTGFGRLT